MQGILTWVVFGAIVGLVTQLLIGKERFGCFTNVIVGIIGSFIGGMLFEYFGKPGITGFNLYSIFVSVIGATVFVVLLKMIRK